MEATIFDDDIGPGNCSHDLSDGHFEIPEIGHTRRDMLQGHIIGLKNCYGLNVLGHGSAQSIGPRMGWQTWAQHPIDGCEDNSETGSGR